LRPASSRSRAIRSRSPPLPIRQPARRRPPSTPTASASSRSWASMAETAKLFELIRTRLNTSVIGDVMDVEGLTRQFLPREIRALKPETMIVGTAMPVLEADCVGDVLGHSGQKDSFGLMLRALDDLKPGEIYICTGASP